MTVFIKICCSSFLRIDAVLLTNPITWVCGESISASLTVLAGTDSIVSTEMIVFRDGVVGGGEEKECGRGVVGGEGAGREWVGWCGVVWCGVCVEGRGGREDQVSDVGERGRKGREEGDGCCGKGCQEEGRRGEGSGGEEREVICDINT